mgnify:CR=1 FL=1
MEEKLNVVKSYVLNHQPQLVHFDDTLTQTTYLQLI